MVRAGVVVRLSIDGPLRSEQRFSITVLVAGGRGNQRPRVVIGQQRNKPGSDQLWLFIITACDVEIAILRSIAAVGEIAAGGIAL